MPDSVVTALAQYGLAGLFALIIGWVLYRVGLRMIAALDRVVVKLDEHTKTDVEWHGHVERALVSLQTRVDTIAELTPVETPFGNKRPTPPPGAVYAMHKRRGGDERRRRRGLGIEIPDDGRDACRHDVLDHRRHRGCLAGIAALTSFEQRQA